MSTITTRAGKGSALTHNELDTNFKRGAQVKVATYTVAAADNRDLIECSGTFTISLPDVPTVIAATDTGDFVVAIKNTGSGVITVGRITGADTIDGVAADLTLESNKSVTLKVNNAGSGYNIIGEARTDSVLSVTGTGASTTLGITSGLGGTEYDFEIVYDSDNAGGGTYKIEINSDTTVTNYWIDSTTTVANNTNTISSVANAVDYNTLKGKIFVTANDEAILMYDAYINVSATPTLERVMIYMTSAQTAINSIELKELVTGGNFKTTSYIKLSKAR
jgi:hypothetical protein